MKYLLFYSLLQLIVAVGVSYAQNDVRAKKEAIYRLTQDIEFLDSQIKEANKKHKNTLTELNLYHHKAEARKRLIEELEKNISNQEKQIGLKSNQILQAQSQIDTLKIHYAGMIKKAYKNRDNRTWFIYILAGKNIEQGYRRWSYLRSYSKALNNEGKKIKERQIKLQKEKEQLQALKRENERSQQAKTSEYESLKTEEKKRQTIANTLSRQQKTLKAQLQKKQQEAAGLQKELERLIAKSGKYTATAENVRLSGAFSDNKGKLPWPVGKGIITEKFGINKHPTLKNVNLPFNNGINISAPRGADVTAVFEGVVKQIILIPGYSNCVLVSHGRYFTFYCKLGRVNVRSGEKVAIGQKIGTLDTKGESSELHFELWDGKQKQNPVNWLRK